MVADVCRRSYSVFNVGIGANVVYRNLGGRKMIKCNKGVVVAASGEAQTILAELAWIIEAVHEKLMDVYGKETADEMIVLAGQVAFMETDEIVEEIGLMDELLKEVKE